MTRPFRRTTDWGRRPRDNGANPTSTPPEPPEFLGTWRWRQAGPLETTEAWFERTKQQRAEVVARASTWLCIGRTVKVHLDARYGGDVAGRTGTIYRLCSLFLADFTNVHFPATPKHALIRVRLLPLEILTPIE